MSVMHWLQNNSLIFPAFGLYIKSIVATVEVSFDTGENSCAYYCLIVSQMYLRISKWHVPLHTMHPQGIPTSFDWHKLSREKFSQHLCPLTTFSTQLSVFGDIGLLQYLDNSISNQYSLHDMWMILAVVHITLHEYNSLSTNGVQIHIPIPEVTTWNAAGISMLGKYCKWHSHVALSKLTVTMSRSF